MNPRRLERWALICLLLLAFLPRALYPVSRPLQWYFRSSEFVHAILNADWSGTLFSPHPGVTVMWLSGGALWGWYALQSLLGLPAPSPLQTEGYALADRVAVGVLPLALIAALAIVWGWHLLRRLFGARIAWIAAVLWAIDPFHLANSKVLHLDATVSMLMILSALHMLAYLQYHERRTVILSGVLGGLAILTKVTALFLVPFLGLCLLTDCLSSMRNGKKAVRLALRASLLWLLVATAVCFALWPSLWVQPKATFDTVIERGILQKLASAHDLPRFHRGILSLGDPGTSLYLDALLYRSTFLTLTFSILALALIVSRRAQKEILLLACFAAFYLVQMTLGSRKETRYLLPAFVAFDVLSAWAIVWWSDRVSKVRTIRLSLSGGLLLAQALLILPLHPYYGTHYNVLLGGGRAAQDVLPLAQFGEGLDLAGRYIDRQSGAETAIIGTQFLADEMVSQHARASVEDLNQTGDDADYLVFGVQYTMRGKDLARWGALWERTYKFREPAYVAILNGIPYAWVHKPSAERSVPQQADIRLGDSIRLAGFRSNQSTLSPGDPLLLTLYWRAIGPMQKSYTVFMHLQNREGELIAQMDGLPAMAERPTTTWQAGDLIEDPREISIPTRTSSGRYLLSTGMYDPTSMDRLIAFDAAGERLPNDRIPLATIHVEPSVPWWRWVLSGLWLTAIVAGLFRADHEPTPSYR